LRNLGFNKLLYRKVFHLAYSGEVDQVWQVLD